jgi:hypothetical protein
MKISKRDMAKLERIMAEAGTPIPAAKKRSKWRNVPTVVDGIRFASGKEAARWSQLRIMERSGVIRDLERQVSFDLRVGGILVCRYVADFVYFEDGVRIVEDCKGARLREYLIKRELMLACHGIAIRET